MRHREEPRPKKENIFKLDISIPSHSYIRMGILTRIASYSSQKPRRNRASKASLWDIGDETRLSEATQKLTIYKIKMNKYIFSSRSG